MISTLLALAVSHPLKPPIVHVDKIEINTPYDSAVKLRFTQVILWRKYTYGRRSHLHVANWWIIHDWQVENVAGRRIVVWKTQSGAIMRAATNVIKWPSITRHDHEREDLKKWPMENRVKYKIQPM